MYEFYFANNEAAIMARMADEFGTVVFMDDNGYFANSITELFAAPLNTRDYDDYRLFNELESRSDTEFINVSDPNTFN